MSLAQNILVQPGALTPELLAEFAAALHAAPRQDSLVSTFRETPGGEAVEWVLDRQTRDTQEVQLSAAVTAQLDGLLRAWVAAHINPFYAVEVRDWEPLQVLHYGPGGHYVPHVDAEAPLRDEELGLELWEKTLDRDLSVVCFLNDDFAGGELQFPDLGLVIPPQAGTLVCFPADHHYLHGVQPVTAGHRYTLVTWLRVTGMPSPEELNAQLMEAHNRAYPHQVAQPPRLSRGGGVSLPG
jgi:predicted 2-oxoglutarate/Fe(II)-dependent dioxygenase YbiX